MQAALYRSITELLREIDQLKTLLEAHPPLLLPELKPFHDWLINECEGYGQRANEYFRRLGLGQDAILSNVLSDTQNLTLTFRVFNTHLISPVLRARPADRLALKILRWLHSCHPQTRHIPVAFSDGGFSSWYPTDWPAIYYIPIAEQHRLLYLPICFHEFGHVLYECHKPEMEALVKGLQAKIADILDPPTQRDDLHDQYEMRRRKRIVETWHEWTHELFCDAVGFIVGGPAFIYAFSTYFSMLGRDEYHLKASDLAYRVHPVTWMRVRILADRIRKRGYKRETNVFEDAWAEIADALKITEEYYGFYTPEFLPEIQMTIDDMLTEAAPRSFDEAVTTHRRLQTTASTPVELINQAWQEFMKSPEQYPAWEQKMLAEYIVPM
jgi:hypothetical protein